MAAARVYVGAHFPAEVAAGLVLGAVVVLLGGLAAVPALRALAVAVQHSALRPWSAPESGTIGLLPIAAGCDQDLIGGRPVSGLLDHLTGLASPWAYVVVGLLAALEASAFVGLFIPGELALLSGGYVAFQGRASLGVMMLVAAGGAVAGDSIGYEIGRHFGDRLRHSRLGRRSGAMCSAAR